MHIRLPIMPIISTIRTLRSSMYRPFLTSISPLYSYSKAVDRTSWTAPRATAAYFLYFTPSPMMTNARAASMRYIRVSMDLSFNSNCSGSPRWIAATATEAAMVARAPTTAMYPRARSFRTRRSRTAMTNGIVIMISMSSIAHSPQAFLTGQGPVCLV